MYKSDQYDSMSKRIQIVLTGLGLKQKELADLLEVKPQLVNSWLKGRSKPNPECIIKLSQMSHQSLMWVEHGLGPFNNNTGKKSAFLQSWSANDVDSQVNDAPNAYPKNMTSDNISMDVIKLEEAIALTTELLQEHGGHLEPSNFAMVVASTYKALCSNTNIAEAMKDSISLILKSKDDLSRGDK